MKREFEYRTRVPLRWRDVDRLGHLNQAVYHELLAEARMGLLSGIVPRPDGDEAFGTWVVVRVELDHHAEVRKEHGDVDVVARLGRLGTSSLRLDYNIVLQDGTLAASGSTVLVAWDPVLRRKRPITGPERAALS
jgi:acyl-CoA thioester hydrolase